MTIVSNICLTKSISRDQIQDRNCKNFRKHFGTYPDLVSIAPGRINIIGEHTDYSEGLAMPAAINRWVVISFRKRADDKINVISENYDGSLLATVNGEFETDENWQKFVHGAVFLLTSQYIFTGGFDAYISGNVPIGSGVSSSAAVEVALLNGLRSLYQLNLDDLNLVRICQQIEHKFLGVKCGLMDQYTSQFSKNGKAMVLDFQSLTHRYVDANLDGYSWVLVNTMVHRELSSSKYTERVNEMSELDKIVKRNGFRHLREFDLLSWGCIDNSVLKKRIKHYVTAITRVGDAENALISGNIKQLGEILNSSHMSLKQDYQISCDELDFLTETAADLEGCYGARMMGGGFGGCTINLVKDDFLTSFSTQITNAYLNKFQINPEVNVYQMVDGASIF